MANELIPNIIEEDLLQQEMILGMLTGLGMLLMVVSEVLGMLIVILGVLAVSGIYAYRIYRTLKIKGEVVYCCFSWFNNVSMILAVAGILMLMLMNAHSRIIFIAAMGLMLLGLIVNIALRPDRVPASLKLLNAIRLLVGMVLLVVFYLL